MLLVLTWPRMSQQFQLNEAITEQNAVCFSMEKGEFTPHSMGDRQNEVRFYRHASESMIVNQSSDFICIINGKELSPVNITLCHLVRKLNLVILSLPPKKPLGKQQVRVLLTTC